MAARHRCSRALLVGALLLALAPIPALAEPCPSDSIDRHATVAAVHDGDTVRLTGGRDVRLIGINTPEMGRDGEPDEPGARAARRALEAIVAEQHQRIALEIGAEREDRYGRLLAHPYTPDGRNITRLLLERGLGWQVVVPPNLGHVECYATAETAARAGDRGLWSQAGGGSVAAAALPTDAGGFHIVHGRVERVGASRRALWLELDGLTLRLDRRDLPYFDGDPRQWKGRSLRVRGWIYRVNGEARMNLQHPAAIEWLESDS